jgi:hypothetical protein
MAPPWMLLLTYTKRQRADAVADVHRHGRVRMLQT